MVTNCEDHQTVPIVFNRDLALIQHPIRLYSSKDLAEIIDSTPYQTTLKQRPGRDHRK